ncbi:hypothetical protein Pint_21480 [Pistacia integerrima]|uniref:Uncharacterized protein n=1 Tax=Pistacia integerrima TaxID=434235 RepID=A0ACC0X7U2_9ROSI|nr:hypothetical protein Pint_21480 [Pistacia integerrima]
MKKEINVTNCKRRHHAAARRPEFASPVHPRRRLGTLKILLGIECYDIDIALDNMLGSEFANKVMNIHKSLEKFLSLIPFLISTEEIKLVEVDWGRELVDDFVPSKLRVLTGMKFLLFYLMLVIFEKVLLLVASLEKVWDVKPSVNGKDIMNVLQLKSRGPLVREWQQKLLAWQLAHPSGTGEGCLDWMKQTHSKCEAGAQQFS